MSNENIDIFTEIVNNNKKSKDALEIAEQAIQQALYFLNIAKNNPNDKTIEQAHDITQEAIRLASTAYHKATTANSIDDQRKAEQLFKEAKEINEEIEKLNINNKFNISSEMVQKKIELDQKRIDLLMGKYKDNTPIPKSLRKEPVLCKLAKDVQDIAYYISNHKKQMIATVLIVLALSPSALFDIILRTTANNIKDTTANHLISSGFAEEQKIGFIFEKLALTQSPKKIVQELNLKSADAMRIYLNLFLTNFNTEEIDAILKEAGYQKGTQEFLEELGYQNKNGKSAYQYFVSDYEKKLKNIIQEMFINPEAKEKYLEQYPELARFYNKDANQKGRSH